MMALLKDCKVLVTPTSYGSMDPGLKTKLEELVGEVHYNDTGKPLSSDQLQDLLPGCQGMIAGLDEIDRAALKSAAELKVVSRYGVGINNVDLEAARELGIKVTNTPGANAAAVADLTIALMLNLLRPILPAVQKTKAGEWPRYKGYSLSGKTVGIIGCGAIGRETIRRLAGFDCQVIAVDIFPDERFAADYGFEYQQLDQVLAQADIISLHLPGSTATEGIVNSDFLAKMKQGSWLVNTARGNLIDEEALLEALSSGKLRGAALDAYIQEPPSPDNPLLKMDQVITTPHMGAHADSATNEMGRIALDECLAVLRGEEPKYQVN
jgi:D-3-phosphoglycerate dehydrogenase